MRFLPWSTKDWNEWTACSASCGDGNRVRRVLGQVFRKVFEWNIVKPTRKPWLFNTFQGTKFQTRNFSDNVRPHEDSVANLSQTPLPLRFLGQELEPTSTDCCRCSHNWVVLNMLKWVIQWPLQTSADKRKSFQNGYGSIPIHTIFRGDEHPFTSYFDLHQGIGFWPIPK